MVDIVPKDEQLILPHHSSKVVVKKVYFVKRKMVHTPPEFIPEDQQLILHQDSTAAAKKVKIVKREEIADVAPAFARPNICRTCFGTNAAARLANYFRKDCKLCKRSFKSMKWDGLELFEIRTTEICNKCSEAEKVCRVCGQACLEAEHLSASIRVQEETARSMPDVYYPWSGEPVDEEFCRRPLLNFSYIC